MTIGEIIKNIRLSSGKTRKEVVDSLGITEAYLCAIEKNKRHPEIPKNGDGTLNIEESMYYKILTWGLSKNPKEAFSLILDWKLSELGVDDQSLKEPLKDLINGNLSLEGKKAILATYFGVKFQEDKKSVEQASDGKLKKYINDITLAYRKISNSIEERVFLEQAEATSKEYRDKLHNLANGTFEKAPEDYLDAMDIIRYAKKHIYCTSYVDNKTWWESNTGKRYFEVNKEAVANGVEITRIFILRKDELASCRKILKQQQAAGIDVYVAYVEDLPDNLIEDFLLQDDKILFKNDLTPEGKIRRNVVSISDTDIAWAKRTFSALQQHAEEFKTS